MKKSITLPALICLFVFFSINSFADEVKIIKENKAGFWGFNTIEENHKDGVSTLQCSGVGFVAPEFVVSPTSLRVEKSSVNKFVKKLFKKIDKSDLKNGTFEKYGLKATWQITESGATEITVQSL